MLLASTLRTSVRRRSAFTLMEVLVVVAILVILAGVAIVAVPKYLDEARKGSAHTAAKSLQQSCDSYQISSSNTTHEFPPQLGSLITPPFGGTSYLKNGEKDLYTPWGKVWDYEIQQSQQGTQYVYIHTQAPDGTVISNFGVGEAARPTIP